MFHPQQTRRRQTATTTTTTKTIKQQVGRALAEAYWRPGNGAPFLGLVEALTGAPLSADAWTARLETPLEDLLARERADYDAAIKEGPK